MPRRDGPTLLTTKSGPSRGVVLLAVTLVGCASVVPGGLREQVRSVPFATLQSPPAVSGLEPPVVSHVEPLLMARHLHVWPPPLFPGGPDIGFGFGYEGSIGF
ncbi:MAG: hypothetical protein ACREKR_11240 [Candidatus Methylomirabilales bacterium]